MSASPNAWLTFRSARKFQGPAWLTLNGESLLLGYSLDVLKDAWIERLRQGLLARFPQINPNGDPPAPDALAAIGRDRGLVQGVTETAAHFGTRLVDWLPTLKTKGNPFALLGQLAQYLPPGFSFRTVDVRGNWYSLDSSGNQTAVLNEANWDWDGASDALTRWSRFWVILYPNGLWTDTDTWGHSGDTWGDGRCWGMTSPSDQVQNVISLIKAWKPAGTKCVNLIVAFDNTSFDPTTARDGTGLPNGTWGSWSTGGRIRVASGRLSTARFVGV
jgi:hypothetical protein